MKRRSFNRSRTLRFRRWALVVLQSFEIFLSGTVPLLFAHSRIASINHVSYIFGGYNGVSSDKLFYQNMTSNWCAMFSSETSCSKVRNCVWCKDTARNLTACFISNTYSHLSCSNTSNICRNDASMMPRAAALTSSTDLCVGKSGPGMCSSCIQGNENTNNLLLRLLFQIRCICELTAFLAAPNTFKQEMPLEKASKICLVKLSICMCIYSSLENII